MSATFIFTIWLLAASVESAPTDSVQHFGTLREMMHDGKVGPVVDLPDVVSHPRSIGVGALSNLRGEVTILDGQIWYSYPEGDEAVRTLTASTQPETAALLVLSAVDSWQEIPVGEDLTLSTLETKLAEVARERGFETAFPFLVEALFPAIDLHVIDGQRLKAGASHEEHRAASVTMALEKVPATLVGFHSNAHQGIFTHHGQTTHVHAIVAHPLVTGHVDAVSIPAGATIKVPR